MRQIPSPQGFALTLIVLGILTALSCAALVFATDVDAWRYGIAAGCLAQFTGWVLTGRRNGGGR